MGWNRQAVNRLLDAARELDIGENPAPDAIYEPGGGGFQIWCTPQDYPPKGGWEEVIGQMTAGAFTKPCVFVASVYFLWNQDAGKATHIVLETEAYELRNFDSFRYSNIKNRPADVAWAKEKIAYLVNRAGLEMLPVVLYADIQEEKQSEQDKQKEFEDKVETIVAGFFNEAAPDTSVQEKIYRGFFNPDGDIMVTVNGEPLPVISRFSGDGFAWGYGGTGPAVLARSILADYFGENPTPDDLYWGRCKCEKLHQEFKAEFVAKLEPDSEWVILGSEIARWVETLPPEMLAIDN